jgi:hypothetical protein
VDGLALLGANTIDKININIINIIITITFILIITALIFSVLRRLGCGRSPLGAIVGLRVDGRVNDVDKPLRPVYGRVRRQRKRLKHAFAG